MLKDSLKVAEGELLMVLFNYGSCVSLYQPARRDVPTSAIVAWQSRGATNHFLIVFDAHSTGGNSYLVL